MIWVYSLLISVLITFISSFSFSLNLGDKIGLSLFFISFLTVVYKFELEYFLRFYKKKNFVKYKYLLLFLGLIIIYFSKFIIINEFFAFIYGIIFIGW